MSGRARLTRGRRGRPGAEGFTLLELMAYLALLAALLVACGMTEFTSRSIAAEHVQRMDDLLQLARIGERLRADCREARSISTGEELIFQLPALSERHDPLPEGNDTVSWSIHQDHAGRPVLMRAVEPCEGSARARGVQRVAVYTTSLQVRPTPELVEAEVVLQRRLGARMRTETRRWVFARRPRSGEGE